MLFPHRVRLTLLAALIALPLAAQTITYTDGTTNATDVDTTGATYVLTIASGVATQAGILTGDGRVNKTGAGALVFSSDNAYTGGTTVSAGMLQLGNGGGTGSILGNVTDNGALVFDRSGDVTFDGVISGSGGVVNEGNILRFSAVQTYTGPTQINSGVLVLPTAVDNALSSSMVVTVATGAKLDLSGRNQILAGLDGGGAIYSFHSTASTLTLDVGADESHVFAGNLGSTDPNFSLTKSGDGSQTLSGANTYTGATTINGGTLQAAGNGALSTTSAIAVNNAGTTLAINYGGASDYTEAQAAALLAKTTFGASTTTLAFDTTHASGPATYGDALAMNAGFTKLGAGTLVLTGNNTYSGATLISAGNLQVGNGGAEGALPAGTAVTNNGTLVFNLSGPTAQRDIAGSGAIAQQGSGILTLSGTNTYAGATTIDSGTLSLAGTLGGGGAIAISGSGALSETATGVIGGASTLTVEGSGTSILAGSNTYTGATFIGAGTLQMGDGGVTGSLSPASVIVVDGTLAFDRSDTVTQGLDFASSLTGSGQLVQQGSGTLVLLGTNTLGSGVVANSGTMRIGDGIHSATLQAGAGTNGALGVAGDPNLGVDPARNGGAGGAGGSAFVVNSGGTLDLSSQITLVAGAGGNGGQGAGLTVNAVPGIGGSGGAGGNAIVVNDGTLSNLPAQSTITGGAGGNGGETGYTPMLDPPQTLVNVGGKGGAGGTAVLFVQTSSWASSGTLTGGAGGITGRGIGSSPSSGSGGAGIVFSLGGSLANLGTITGGDGGEGGLPSAGVLLALDLGKPGGDGGPGVAFGANGSLTNSGAINGGRGGAGGDVPSYSREPNTGGTGGNGGTAVTFSAGGSLTNSGTISGGLGGVGGSSDIPGANGGTGSGVVFSGGAGTLANQSGGAINGSVIFDHYANTVTLETGSTINGDLNLNTHTDSTLTLTGSGSATYSQAVTGATTFAGSLFKTGTGTWTLDQALAHGGGTTISAGTIHLANTSGSALGTGTVTVGSGAFLTGTGSFTGALTVNAGGTLAPGNSPGLMTIGSGSVFNGIVAIQVGGLTRGTDYDAIDVAGAGEIAFGGTLEVSLINGFSPVLGDSFDLFNFTTGAGTFATLDLPDLSAGLSWDTTALYSTGSLGVVASAVPEPATCALLFGLGALGLALWRRQIKR